MTHKSGRIAARVAALEGGGMDARYLGYFDCFNRQEFYQAHEVLEDLWLLDRRGADGDFYKGLIQLAGAFVHLQKNRLRPCVALLRLARRNLGGYPTPHHELGVDAVVDLTRQWEARVERATQNAEPGRDWCYPRLRLRTPGGDGARRA